MQQKYRKLLVNVLWTAIIAGLLVFFLEPNHEYIAKIIYVLVLAGFGFYHYRLGNFRAVVICGIGTLFLLVTLPGFKIVSEIGVILSLIAWGVLLYIGKRREQSGGDDY